MLGEPSACMKIKQLKYAKKLTSKIQQSDQKYVFFHSKIKKPAKNAKIRLKIRRSRGALIAGTTICLYENKTTEMGKSFTFKIQKYDQKYVFFTAK